MLPSFPFQNLLDWYRIYGRTHLPWRVFVGLPEKEIAYRVWLSEILLQQTQAPRVVGFFNRILEKFPTVEKLAEARYEEFFPYYDGLGYYSRARNLLAAARMVSEEYGGIFPRESELLRKLPGVGPYTAEAIRAFAYDIPTLSFDTNLEKIFSRYYFADRHRKLLVGEKTEIISDFLAGWFSAREMNAALMDFASMVSLNNKSRVDFKQAEILTECQFAKTRGEMETEKKAKSNIFPTKDAKIIVLLSDHAGKIWYGPRSSSEKREVPFFLPANPDLDHRSVVKLYFLEKYGIAVSVRPAFLKEFVEDVPYVFYRARVQTGDAAGFPEFTKAEQEHWLREFQKSPRL